MSSIAPSTVQQVLECLCGFAVRSYGQDCRSKYIVSDGAAVTVECCYQLIDNLNIEHPIGQILHDCVSTFHNKYGCGVRSLLCLTLVWYRSYISLSRQGCSRTETYQCFDKLLNVIITIINDLSTNIRPLLEANGGTTLPAKDIPSANNTNHSIVPLIDTASSDSSAQGSCSSGGFDDIAWYFLPDDSGTQMNIPRTSKSHPRPPSIQKSTRNCVHSDDEDFVDCFDSLEEVHPPTTIPAPINNIDWLDQALNSVKSKSGVSKPAPSHTVYAKYYSHNLNTEASCNTLEDDYIVDSLQSLVLNAPSQSLTPVTDPIPAVSPHKLSSVGDIIRGVSRSNGIVAKLLNKAIEYGSQDDSNLNSKHLDNITTVRCVGASSILSEMCLGTVVECDSDVIGLVSKKQIWKCQALLFQGDLHPNYTHTGYKQTVNFKKVVQSKDLVSNANAQSWCEVVLNSIAQSKVNCLLMKGYCLPTLKQNLLSQEVIVLENIGYKLLSYLSEQCRVPILHYSDDINSSYSCELDVSTLDRPCVGRHTSYLLNVGITSVELPTSCVMQTAILCSPVAEESLMQEERFHHALSRLRGVLDSGQCLLSVTLRDIVTRLHQHTDIWRSEDSTLSTVTAQFIQELSTLITHSDASSDDITHIDDLSSTISAWETSLSACKYISSVSTLVQVGEQITGCSL